MNVIEKKIEYFTNYGSQNTERIIEIVKKRVEEGDINTVVLASTSGETGVKFSKHSKTVRMSSLFHTRKCGLRINSRSLNLVEKRWTKHIYPCT